MVVFVSPRSHIARLAAAFALIAVCAPAPALAQSYPDKPVHLYFPYPAGCRNYVIARLL